MPRQMATSQTERRWFGIISVMKRVLIFMLVGAVWIVAFFYLGSTSEWGGIVFTAVSIVVFLLLILKWMTGPKLGPAQIAQLKTDGQRVMAQFKALDRRWNIEVNGQSPVVIYAQDGNGNTYESENLWFTGADSASYDDPQFQAWQKLQANGQTKKYLIPVYINKKNPRQYYMDLAGLQEQS